MAQRLPELLKRDLEPFEALASRHDPLDLRQLVENSLARRLGYVAAAVCGSRPVELWYDRRQGGECGWQGGECAGNFTQSRRRIEKRQRTAMRD